jgi:hypothetical protein
LAIESVIPQQKKQFVIEKKLLPSTNIVLIDNAIDSLAISGSRPSTVQQIQRKQYPKKQPKLRFQDDVTHWLFEKKETPFTQMFKDF